MKHVLLLTTSTSFSAAFLAACGTVFEAEIPDAGEAADPSQPAVLATATSAPAGADSVERIPNCRV